MFNSVILMFSMTAFAPMADVPMTIETPVVETQVLVDDFNFQLQEQIKQLDVELTQNDLPALGSDSLQHNIVQTEHVNKRNEMEKVE